MKHFKLPILGLVLSCTLVSCEKESVDPIENQDSVEVQEVTQLEVTEEVSEVFKKNFFNSVKVGVIDFHLPDGTIEQRYQIEDDITFSVEQFEHLAKLGNTTEKNYHTNNLVSPRTLTIIGYTGGSFALSSKERTALQWAVNNYNRLNLSIQLSLSFGTNYQNKDMVVYNNTRNNPGRSGGVAGFPSNGNPNKFIQIYGLSGFSTNVNEHVITHEIGHSVGFRHTDWFSRESCGENVNEGVGSIGANPIPGTPEGYDPTSLMLACFSSNTDGEFNNNDIIALQYLY
ncbi:M57 family metalloprotease [Allomuricauda sp. d1]|uniref:M57 family metalloprotease n=1 Tax=Allomuricauda sp. d1 TaxID=3136725 RepID=UPI0031CE0A87